MDNVIFIKLLLSVVFGAILGLETETREIEYQGELKAKKLEKGRLGGFRTYTLISLLGGITGIFYLLKLESLVFVLFLGIFSFILVAYYLNVQLRQAFGLTTEIAILITFTLGFLTTSELVRFELLLGILMLIAFFLSQKRGIGKFISKFQHKEFIDIIKFGLISLLLLPILPNEKYTVSSLSPLLGNNIILSEEVSSLYLINPFEMWLIIVIISGINLLAYYLTKLIGANKGIIVTSVLGGFISSTSTLISFANKSKSSNLKEQVKLSGGAIIATSFSYIFAISIFAVINSTVLGSILSLTIPMLLSSFVIGIFIIIVKGRDDKSPIKDEDVKYEPFSVLPAIKFVLLIIIITFSVQVLQLLNINDSLIVFITAISGLTSSTPAIIALSNLYDSSVIDINILLSGFFLTVCVNFFAKSVYSKMMGSNAFFRYISLSLFAVILIGVIALFITIT
jgi:uncharacterized membrane protein (DUF4010 family)